MKTTLTKPCVAEFIGTATILSLGSLEKNAGRGGLFDGWFLIQQKQS